MNDINKTLDTKPSDDLMADAYWFEFFQAGVIDLQEAERRAQGSLRMKEMYSKDPWYAKKTERDPNFWSKFYSSRINS